MNIHDTPGAVPLSKVRTNPPTKIGPISSESQREWVASDTVRASMLPSGVVVVTVKREGATFGRAFHLASGGVEVELDCSGMEAREAMTATVHYLDRPLHPPTPEAPEVASKEPEPAEPAAPGDKVDGNADPCASGHTPGELVPDSCARCGADLGKPAEPTTTADGASPPAKRRGRKPSGGPKA